MRQDKPADTPLTIGEVAARVRDLGRNPLTVTENLRHYAKLGFFNIVGGAGEGTGRHRQYDPDAVYDAAILVALADAGLHPGEQRWIADAISMCRHTLREWKQARRKGQTTERFFTVSFYPPQRTAYLVHGPGRPAKKRPIESTAVEITINIGLLWSTLEKAAEGARQARGEE
jgi:hypothetical protein